MPHLPRGDYKIVIRPTGGIKLSEHGVVNLTAAVQDAAGIPAEEREEDIICPNNYKNILIASTPDQEHANKYQAIARIKVQGKFYATNAYETAPDLTAKGVIKGIPLDEGPRDITAAVVTTKNPTAIAAKRLSNTTTVIVLFEGHKVPTFVRYRAALLRCSLYRNKWIFVANATDLDTGETYVPTLTTSFVPVVEPPIQMKVIGANQNASYAVRTIPPQTRHAKPNSRSPSLLSRDSGKDSNRNGNKNMKTLSQETTSQTLAASPASHTQRKDPPDQEQGQARDRDLHRPIDPHPVLAPENRGHDPNRDPRPGPQLGHPLQQTRNSR
ncbi:hypothetical protein MTO96_031673 [Rhipicephalus appendiculatus]